MKILAEQSVFYPNGSGTQEANKKTQQPKKKKKNTYLAFLHQCTRQWSSTRRLRKALVLKALVYFNAGITFVVIQTGMCFGRWLHDNHPGLSEVDFRVCFAGGTNGFLIFGESTKELVFLTAVSLFQILISVSYSSFLPQKKKENLVKISWKLKIKCKL